VADNIRSFFHTAIIPGSRLLLQPFPPGLAHYGFNWIILSQRDNEGFLFAFHAF
jgi:hypothetical protein